MSTLLRLLKTTHSPSPIRTLHTLRPTRPLPPKMSNYFSPSHSPFPRPPTTNLLSKLPLPRRLYSHFAHAAARDRENANKAVLYSLMGINVAVFSWAMYAKAQAAQGYPQAYIDHMRAWSCNYTDVMYNGMWWTTMTSTFSHVDLWHIAANMLTAYYLGQFLCYAPMITPLRFLTIALGAGATGSVGFLYQRHLVTGGGKGVDYQRGLGFSGALMGITSVAACLAPRAKVHLYGIIPVPLWGIVLGYAVYDGYYLNNENSRIGHAGHLGGLAFGIGYYLLRLRGLRI